MTTTKSNKKKKEKIEDLLDIVGALALGSAILKEVTKTKVIKLKIKTRIKLCIYILKGQTWSEGYTLEEMLEDIGAKK